MKLNQPIIWGAGLFIIVILVVVGAKAYRDANRVNLNSQSESVQSAQDTNQTSESGGTMQSEDIKLGEGDEAIAGKKVTVHYIGTLTNGQKFDSSRDIDRPFSFTLGAGEVIEGWDEGVVGMKVGGLRKLTIPPDMGYGSHELDGIPANSTLVFEVELLGVE